MRIELQDVAKGDALPPTSTSFATGTATLVEAETEQRPTVLGLIASGRMKPAGGTVLLDGERDDAAIRRVTALVDAPDVCDPAPDVAVLGLVEEELMFAGRPSNPVAARRWLSDNGYAELGRLPISDVAPRDRIALLLELTALRRRVEAMVLVSPDRHGGDPNQWWQIVEEFAERGYAMLVVAGAASAAVLDGLTPSEGDSAQQRADLAAGALLSADSPSLEETTPADEATLAGEATVADQATLADEAEPDTATELDAGTDVSTRGATEPDARTDAAAYAADQQHDDAAVTPLGHDDRPPREGDSAERRAKAARNHLPSADSPSLDETADGAADRPHDTADGPGDAGDDTSETGENR